MLIPKKNYTRDKAYRKWLSTQPCLRCGIVGLSQAAHTERGGRGIKGNDTSCIPLCANSESRLGCHATVDGHFDKWWNYETAIDEGKRLYEQWKSMKKQ